MKRTFSSKQDRILRNPLASRNWETDIHKVLIEPCETGEDPLGYRAIFLLGQESARAENKKSFAVGASFLAQRGRHLEKAGYTAPMTRRAIAMIEDKIGKLSDSAVSSHILIEEMA
jgi:hypothetical protein